MSKAILTKIYAYVRKEYPVAGSGVFQLVALSALCTVGLIYLITPVLSEFFKTAVDINAVVAKFALHPGDFAPKPEVMRTYLLILISFPIILLAAQYLTKFFNLDKNRMIFIFFEFLIFFSLLFFASRMYFTSNSYISDAYLLHTPQLLIPICLFSLALIISPWVELWYRGLLVAMAVAIGVSILAFGISSSFTEYVDHPHFQAVFSPLVHVSLGKVLWFNLDAQYGMYPLFLNFVFKLTGLSVFKFTVIQTSLFLASLLLILLGLVKMLINKSLAMLVWIGIVFFCYPFLFFVPQVFDPYFQNWPIRFLFPAAFIFIVSVYFHNPKRWLYILGMLLGSIAVFWNLETGAICWLSWLLVLYFWDLTSNNLKLSEVKTLRHVFWAMCSILLVFGLLNVNSYLMTGFPLNVGEFIKLQKAFMVSGLYHMPFPGVGSWHLVALIYLIGVGYSVASLFTGTRGYLPTVCFFLSILGCGLFSYYTGRSHDRVLLVVSYPAFVLMGIYLDSLVARIRKKSVRPSELVISFFPLILILASPFHVLSGLNTFIETMQIGKKTKGQALSLDPVILDFIKHHTSAGEVVEFISYISANYYLESKTVFAVNPDFVQSIFLSQHNNLINHIRQKKIGKVFVDKDFIEKHIQNNPVQFNAKILDAVESAYLKVAESSNGKMMLYVPRSTLPL